MNDFESAAVQVTQPPVAVIRGQPLSQLPRDLYIPPQALEVLLEGFSGPLDLLLYLIKKQRFDILDIPVAEITRQYFQYIELMQILEIELAAEYLVMAALLTEIKSRLLLPKPAVNASDEEVDPRAELMRHLQEYEQTKQAAQLIDSLPRRGRDVFFARIETDLSGVERVRSLSLAVEDLVEAFQSVLTRAVLTAPHAIVQEPLLVRDRMSQILDSVSVQSCKFSKLFKLSEGRRGMVVTFIALLELWRQGLVELLQVIPFGEIEVKAR